MTGWTIHGDCLAALPELARQKIPIASVVTDSPYGIGFLGKKWDSPDNIVFGPRVWEACYRVLRPGGFLLAFASPRTYHRIAYAIENAGFEIRDMTVWVHGQGFPKSLDIAKSIDRVSRGVSAWGGGDPSSPNHRLYEGMGGNGYRTAEGMFNTRANKAAARESVRRSRRVTDLRGSGYMNTRGEKSRDRDYVDVAPVSPDAIKWDGWGTNLKPAQEPIVVARKPIEGNHAYNVLKYGAGALNIDGCRVPGENPSIARRDFARRSGTSPTRPGEYDHNKIVNRTSPGRYCSDHPGEKLGRYPANFIHDGSDEIINRLAHAAPFFYCPKASTNERNGSNHPTVKPLTLMRYLVRLVTPPGGIVLDPFAGSGTTGLAAELEGFGYIMIEREEQYVTDMRRRLASQASLSATVTSQADAAD
jgi:site-specific DNA-methyltransferase (adenine-specific)